MRNDVERMTRFDIEFSVIRAEVRRDLFGAAGLIVTCLVKADGERFHRARALRLHQRNDRRGIDSAGEKRAEWHVGNHPQFDGIAKQTVKPLDGFVRFRFGIVPFEPRYCDTAQVPKTFGFGAVPLPQR